MHMHVCVLQGGFRSGRDGRRRGWGGGRECDGTTALCFLCRSLLFFRARKMGLCNSHVISPEIVVGLQLLPLLLPAAPLLGFWQQPDRHTALRSPPAPKRKKKLKKKQRPLARSVRRRRRYKREERGPTRRAQQKTQNTSECGRVSACWKTQPYN